jgi:hypothetical protein
MGRMKGNSVYSEQETYFGSYSPEVGDYPPPKDVKCEGGFGPTPFGANEEDFKRGYVVPTITNDPRYDIEAYRDKASLPSRDQMSPDEKMLFPDPFPAESAEDVPFAQRGVRSTGFLSRPNGPKERY